jgi:hypothetical protein
MKSLARQFAPDWLVVAGGCEACGGDHRSDLTEERVGILRLLNALGGPC